MKNHCERWASLSDRMAVGEGLREDEQRFLREHGASCRACGAEQAVWSDLASMLDAPAAVEASPRRTWRLGAAVGALSVAAVVLLGLVSRTQREPPPRATVVAPPTYRAFASTGLEVDGRPAGALPVGAVVFARQAACLTVEPAVKACLDEGSLLRVVELSAARRRLELLKGKVTAELDAQPAHSSFGVLTRDGAAIAIGTAFSVELPAQGPAITRVLHGTVLVQSRAGGEARVGAHTMVVMDEQLAVVSTEPAATPSLQQDALPVAAPVAETQWLTVARERRARGDTTGALAAYRALFNQGARSPEARSALIPYGELLLAQGNARAALAAFDRYLAQPEALREEAAYGRLRALRALGARAAEREAIERFLRDHPESPLAAGLAQRASVLASEEDPPTSPGSAL